jgi:hypothetical protein
LLEPAGDKLAKLHGSIPWSELRARYDDPRELCSVLAQAANLGAGTPRELIATFDWARVPADDRVARFDGVLSIT